MTNIDFVRIDTSASRKMGYSMMSFSLEALGALFVIALIFGFIYLIGFLLTL